MPDRPVVMISSTARDLPEHREQVMDACLRLGMQPLMMEHLPASDADAIAESLRMVDKADIYLGVFAHRYGYVPKGHDISITEMEYDRAVKREIPRLIFFMHKDHALKADDVETGPGAEKLKKLKERIGAERVVNYFDCPADLRADVLHSLSEHRRPDVTAFHYVSTLTTPPEPYIAHPYTLLQTKGLIGRQQELNLLTDWVAKETADVYRARILTLVAIGGMGKSALTWKWFNKIAPEEMKPLAGRFWWSFYESDARFENFVTRALAYTTRRSIEEVKKIPPPEREEQLLAVLDREPFLVVLDGLERILIAYARMDAARLADDDLDEQAANVVVGAIGLPESAAESFVGQHRLRKTADPRAGSFLRKLTQVRAARILVSSRLYPAELQTMTGDPLPGCLAYFTGGLSDDDAVNLWRAFGVSGSRETLLPLFASFDKHPLLIQALASEVANFRKAPGEFDKWMSEHKDFDPFTLPLATRKTHVLEFALRGLDGAARKVLHTVSAFRMPTGFDTLAALLVGEDEPCGDEHALDAVLSELEDRGLLGWDRRANRYDLHPIVRGVTWSVLDQNARKSIYTTLHTHFDSLPTVRFDDVSSLEDLTPAIELYSTLIGLGRFDDAYVAFRDRLDQATHFRLSAGRQRVELLEMLFPDGVDEAPRLSDPSRRAYTLNALALAHDLSGQLGRAIRLYRRQNAMQEDLDSQRNVGAGLENLSVALQEAGELRPCEEAARRALRIARGLQEDSGEAPSSECLGTILGARGCSVQAGTALERALRLFVKTGHKQREGGSKACLAQRALWLCEYGEALGYAAEAWELAQVDRHEVDFIRAARLQGQVALGLGDLDAADERLHHALTRARTVNLVEEELPALVALAELRRRQKRPKEARQLLDDVWEPAERGPYPLFHADAFNVLAEIERDAENTEAAVGAATKAFRLAWCDGPPFAYHWGLEAARKHLKEIGAPEPTDLPPFDESKFDPMPEVEIDPLDEPKKE
jgi:tetratricopeptide (TPR) repeat protein